MTLRDDLFAWLSAQEPWQQDLAKRLVGRTQLEGAAYDDAMLTVKSVFGALAEGEGAPNVETVTLEDLPAEPGTGAPRLTSFGRLRGVGAVSADHEVRFAPDGLTVVYGQNAAGKTTYVRALKRVCRTVDCDAEVRGNVFRAPLEGAPTATVEFVVAGERRAQQLNLVDPPDLGLDGLSVFDSRCAELYIDSQNGVAYVPSDLRLLARMAATQDRMRGDLLAEAQQLISQAPAFSEFTETSTVKTLLDGLSARTSIDWLRNLSTLSEQDQRRLTELRAVVASTAARSTRADAEAAHQDALQARALAEALRDLARRLEPTAVDRLRGLAAEAGEAQQAVELAAREFSGLPVDGVGSGPWRRLWQAARAFSDTAGAPFPPPADAHCPLCLQQMGAQAADRLAHFDRHVQSALGAQQEHAAAALRSALEALDERHAQACRTPFLAGLAEREAEIHRDSERFLDAAEAGMLALREDPSGAEVTPIGLDPATRLDAWAQTREAHADALTAAGDPQREGELRRELTELDAREKLSTRLDDVVARVRTLRRVEALGRARSALATNRITIKQRELSEAAVTGVLDAKLQGELRDLRCEHLPVDLHPHTAVGETQVGLRLAGAHGAPRLSEIASEGEQRALSLSFFLAEVATSETDGGIIVDDPVSSLDDERRSYIARRLVEEAGNRQVVVFTHDLPFLLDLTDRAEEAGMEPLVEGVWRLGGEVGRVDDHPPFKAMKLRARIGVLNTEVEQWSSRPSPHDFDDAWRRVCDFYARLRITWERAVEERLFRGVVQRFQREVKTLALDSVVVTPELVATIKDGMTRCSQFVHDEPPGAATTLPGRTQLAADLARLQEFERHTRS